MSKMRTAFLGAGAVIAGSQVIANRAKRVANQRKPFARYWEQSNLAVVSKIHRNREAGIEDPLIFVALGDSAAQGLGAGYVFDGYVPRLAAALADITGREVALINLSVSGAVIPSVLTHQVLSLKGLETQVGIVPDILTCDIGGNDVSYGVDDMLLADYVAALTRSLPEGSFISDVPSFGPGPLGSRAKAISSMIHSYADRDGHHLIELDNFTSSLPLMSYLFRYHATDFFHPNAHAYQHWAQLWLDQIAPTLVAPTVEVADVGPYQPWA